MASFKLRHMCFTVVLFSIAFTCGRGQGGGGAGTQDAIQIVARAALCFDNTTVINACVRALNGTNATICSPPCYVMMTTWMGCLNGILGNIPGYNPGLMQGVQAIFQMACGNATAAAGSAAGGTNGTATSAGGGSNSGATNASSPTGAYMAASGPSQLTSGADGATASLRGIYSSVLISFAGIWLASVVLA